MSSASDTDAVGDRVEHELAAAQDGHTVGDGPGLAAACG